MADKVQATYETKSYASPKMDAPMLYPNQIDKIVKDFTTAIAGDGGRLSVDELKNASQTVSALLKKANSKQDLSQVGSTEMNERIFARELGKVTSELGKGLEDLGVAKAKQSLPKEMLESVLKGAIAEVDKNKNGELSFAEVGNLKSVNPFLLVASFHGNKSAEVSSR